MINTKNFVQSENKIDIIFLVIFAILTLITLIEITYILFFDSDFNSVNNIKNIKNINNINKNNYNNEFLLTNQLPLQLCPQIDITENIPKCEVEISKNNENNNETETENANKNIKENTTKKFVPIITEHHKNTKLPAFDNEENHHLSAAEKHFINAENFAQNNDWKNAQQEYFNAYTKQQNNPIYAYNLAISLEQLNQINFAIQYYQKTIELINKNKHKHNIQNLFTNEKIQSIKQHILSLQDSQNPQNENIILE